MTSSIESTLDCADPNSDSDIQRFPQPDAERAGCLIVTSGREAGRVCHLGERTVIGRRKDCDLVLSEETVSRRHSLILRNEDAYYVHDLGSQNGTFVNNVKISGPTRLDDGDRLDLDVVSLVFHARDFPRPGTAGSRVTGEDLMPRSLVEQSEQMDRPAQVMTALGVQDAIGRGADATSRAKLRAVLQAAGHLGQSTNCDQFLSRVLDSLFDLFPQAMRGYILLSDPSGGELRPAAIRQRQDDSGSPATVRPLTRSVARRAMSQGEALLCSDRPAPEDREESSIFPAPFDSVMCVPLFVPSRAPLGILYLDTEDRRRPFNNGDLEVLASVASLAGHAVEHARLYETQRELDRKEDELAAARRVQRHLLPQEPPRISQYTFFDYYRPALDVGGDYFSYIDLPDGRLAIVLGDVASKGLSAALLMARLTADLRHCLISTPSAADALRQLNQMVVRQELAPLRHISLVVCVLDPARHSMLVANAGHLPPLLRRGETGQVETVEAAEPAAALGVDPEAGFGQMQLELRPGDTVLLSTDGLNQAADDRDARYGSDRLRQALAASSGNAAEVSKAVLADVRRFVGENGYRDDICLTCFQRVVEEESSVLDVPDDPTSGGLIG